MKYQISILALLILAASCGGSKSGGGGNTLQQQDSVPTTTVSPLEPQPLEGKYKALLRPLNTDVSGFLPSGAAEITVAGDTLTVKTYLDDDTQIAHIQSVHEGMTCPTLVHDTNKDGFVDIVEASAPAGRVLIPLDSDLNSQKAGEGIYPIGKNFTYFESAKVDLMFDDLYRPAEDNFAKLTQGAPMNLEGRVVIISGTTNINRVPETVQSVDGKERNVTIPIACGVIKRL